MKIEKLLVQYFYTHKEITLQGIGKLCLNPQVDIRVLQNQHGEHSLPEDAIQFERNPDAIEDDQFIAYIVQQTRKNNSLAVSDLESYLALVKQFLNIGKPFTIEGIGTFHKTVKGEIHFTPGAFVNPVTEKPVQEFKESSFLEKPVKFEARPTIKRQSAIITIIILLLAGLIFYFIKEYKSDLLSMFHKTAPINQAQQTAMEINVNMDTSNSKPDTISAKSSLKKDTAGFKVIIKEYPDSAKAHSAFKRILLTKYGKRIILYKTDSTYKIAVPFTSPLSDSTIQKDSIHKFFMGNTRIEL